MCRFVIVEVLPSLGHISNNSDSLKKLWELLGNTSFYVELDVFYEVYLAMLLSDAQKEGEQWHNLGKFARLGADFDLSC